MKNVVWLSLKEGTPARGYWDQNLFEIAFKKHKHFYKVDGLDEAIVIIPGAYQAGLIREINGELAKLKKCAVIITSDEENNFPTNEIRHGNISIYTTYPTSNGDGIKWLPIWYPPQAEIIKKIKRTEKYDWCFAGQVNHESRKEMVESVKDIPNGHLAISGGFAQGLSHTDYYQLLRSSKIVLCPRGNVSPDSFRLYEALEAGCVPIVEGVYFWNNLFGSLPFPSIAHGASWKHAIFVVLNNYQVYKSTTNIWWKETKKRILSELQNL